MKSLKYSNCVLTIIAVCLIILAISVIGAFPKANANNFVKSPLLEDTAFQGVDLISFNNNTGTVYISKSKVVYISSFGPSQSQINLTGGFSVVVNGTLRPTADKINQ